MLAGNGRIRAIARAGGLVALLLVLGGLGAGCGTTSETDPTPVKTFKITPASGVRTATVVPATTPTAAATSAGGGTTLSILARDTTFDKSELAAGAGEITIELDNADSGLIHNIHFRKGAKASGESVAKTDLEAGPIKQTLKMTLEAGQYYYLCDAHPNMKGILTVS